VDFLTHERNQNAQNRDAEPVGQLDPQSLVAQSVGVLVGSPLLIAGKLPWSFAGVISRMKTALDRIDAHFAALRTWAKERKPVPFIDEGHDFVVGPPMEEAELQRIEQAYGVTLPPEYRSFLARFGDTPIGPGLFRRVNEGLTATSTNRFPLAEPLLGTLSPKHQQLSKELQWKDYRRLLAQWETIAKEDGVLAISDYGCAIFGVLILNGPYCGKVWILHGDTAYYGPFGGSEPLHDESWPPDWTPTEQPCDYTFLEWYESWLNPRLKMAGLLSG